VLSGHYRALMVETWEKQRALAKEEHKAPQLTLMSSFDAVHLLRSKKGNAHLANVMVDIAEMGNAVRHAPHVMVSAMVVGSDTDENIGLAVSKEDIYFSVTEDEVAGMATYTVSTQQVPFYRQSIKRLYGGRAVARTLVAWWRWGSRDPPPARPPPAPPHCPYRPTSLPSSAPPPHTHTSRRSVRRRFQHARAEAVHAAERDATLGGARARR